MKRLILVIYFLSSFIYGVEVEKIIIKGNKFIPEDVIKGILKTREGAEFSLERIREDIRRLFRTGLFKRIEVYSEDGNKNGKPEVIFVVEDLPVIYKVEFKGNDEISDDELKEILGIETELGEVDVEEAITGYTSSPAIEERVGILKTLKLGRILTYREIENLKKRILEYYEKEGFVGTKVDYKLIPKKGASKLVFIIKEGEKVYVKNIEIKGNKSFSARKIKGLLTLKEPNIFLFRLHPAYSEEILKEDVEKVKEFYKSEGFLEAEVSYSVKREGAARYITIEIKEGPRYELEKLIIEGNKLYAYSELVGNILKKNKRKGGYFRREIIEKVKKNIRDKYGEIGFLNVRIEEKVKVDTNKKEVIVVLKVYEGSPVYVNRIRIREITKREIT